MKKWENLLIELYRRQFTSRGDEMNYIELNGKSSQYVQGLIIQSLAPITKPKIRTTVEEIDGRDGDIVTRLGYSAYDKEISIGLSWNYDIDEVIQYFVDNDKGTVVFSNEEDKLYKYEILDQIDFEKLIRFKTAKVKFHVQPFKYSSIETVKTWHKDSGPITDTTNSIIVRNSGNYFSRPTLTIHGTGEIHVYLNALQILTIDLVENTQITIDSEQMEAYNKATSVLMNRNVSGNYENIKLSIGKNVISWDGNVTSFEISNFSRWI